MKRITSVKASGWFEATQKQSCQ